MHAHTHSKGIRTFSRKYFEISWKPECFFCVSTFDINQINMLPLLHAVELVLRRISCCKCSFWMNEKKTRPKTNIRKRARKKRTMCPINYSQHIISLLFLRKHFFLFRIFTAFVRETRILFFYICVLLFFSFCFCCCLA